MTDEKELTKLNKAIWKFGLNLIHLGIKFVQKAFQSLKKPSSISSYTLKEILRNLGFSKKDMISCSDREYQLIDWNTWEWIKDIDLIDKLVYYYDYFDCENFAFLFSSLTAANYQLNSCGVVYGKIYNKDTLNFLGGHAFNVMITHEGEKTLQNPDGTFGKNYGNNGKMYFSRKVVNKEFTEGAFLFRKNPSPEEIKIISLMLNLISKFVSLLSSWVNLVVSDKKRVENITETILTPTIEEKPPQPPEKPQEWTKYSWLTPMEARHSVRVICDEEGLNVDMKNRLCETVKCESNFDPLTVHFNVNGTRDCGIAQFSERYYLKYNNMTCEDAVSNPEKCIRIMAKAFKNGRAKDWICYRKLFCGTEIRSINQRKGRKFNLKI